MLLMSRGKNILKENVNEVIEFINLKYNKGK